MWLESVNRGDACSGAWTMLTLRIERFLAMAWCDCLVCERARLGTGGMAVTSAGMAGTSGMSSTKWAVSSWCCEVTGEPGWLLVEK